MTELDSEILVLERELQRREERTQKEVQALLKESEERSRALIEETKRRLAEKEKDLFGEVERRLREYEAKRRKALDEEWRHLRKMFDAHRVAEVLWGEIHEKLCRRRERDIEA